MHRRTARHLLPLAMLAPLLVLPAGAHASEAGPSKAGAGSAGAVAQLPWSFIAHRTAGSWAEYASLVGGHPVAPYLRLLVVGDGQKGNEAGTWVEVWISQRPGSATQAFRLLISTNPATPGRILRAQARLMGGREQELPVDEWSDAGRSDSIAPGPADAAPPGEAVPETTSLLTPAGSFRARLSTVGKSKVWISKDVPVLGLVRMEVPGGVGLELHALGTEGRGIFDGDRS